MKSILLVTISISLSALVVKAQAQTPGAGSLNQLDRQPIQQPGVFSNPNNSSRQFFQQGRNDLYFLNESEPILQIDEENEKVESEAENDTIQEQNEKEPAE